MNQIKGKLFILSSLLVLSMVVFTGCGNDTGNNPDETTNGITQNNNDSTANSSTRDTLGDDAGNAVGDVIDGAGNAVDDAVDGVENAVDDITEDGTGTDRSTMNNAITSTANPTDASGEAATTNRR